MRFFNILLLLIVISTPAHAADAKAIRLVRKIEAYFLTQNVSEIIKLIPWFGIYDRGSLLSKKEAVRLLRNKDSDFYKRHFLNKDSFRAFLLSGPSSSIDAYGDGHGVMVELHKGPGVKPFFMYLHYIRGAYLMADMPYEEGRKYGP